MALALRWVLALALPLSGAGSSYSLLEMTRADALINASAFGLEGLHIGSGMAFQPTCINIDIDGITDSEGVSHAAAVTTKATQAATTRLHTPLPAAVATAATSFTTHRRHHHLLDHNHRCHIERHWKSCFKVATELGGGLYAMIPENESEMSPLLHFLQYDCTGRLPFADHSVKWIFTEHFIGELRCQHTPSTPPTEFPRPHLIRARAGRGRDQLLQGGIPATRSVAGRRLALPRAKLDAPTPPP
jgi:hypothetical protein